MKTTSIYVSNLCVPCYNFCRYCLLSWNGKTVGVDYKRSENYARRFYEWLKENRPEINFGFYFGYSMEHPQLSEAIDFMNEIGSVGGKFLQLDGMKMRMGQEIDQLLTSIKEHGVEQINMTFYGTREYHDHFAGRKGDYDLMVKTLTAAGNIGLGVSVGIPITRENVSQMEELISEFESRSINKISLFVPHAEGRGVLLDPVRLTEADFDSLSEKAKEHFNRNRYKPEGEWVRERKFSQLEKRMLAISLTPENIEQFEQMSFDETIKYLENLDDDHYAVIPSLEELAEMYGNKDNTEFYSERDLYLHYQRRYIKENDLKLYDINDERQCFSRRF